MCDTHVSFGCKMESDVDRAGCLGIVDSFSCLCVCGSFVRSDACEPRRSAFDADGSCEISRVTKSSR